MDPLKKILSAGFLAVLVMEHCSILSIRGQGTGSRQAFLSIRISIHMKLVFFPMLICSFPIRRILSPRYPCISFALQLGNLSGTFLIPVLFYTYTGILGKNVIFLDLFTFFVSVLTGFRLTFRFTRSCRGQRWETVMNLLILILFFCFLLFTYMPPKIGLFQPPV